MAPELRGITTVHGGTQLAKRRGVRTTIVMLGLGMVCAGCEVGTMASPDEELDESLLETVGSYHQQAAMNARPMTSELGPFAINWYVEGDRASYARIHPDRMGSEASIARGTVIVREVLDGTKVTKLTVMAKGPPGYDPSLGDWWFAVTDPQGTPLVENGVVQLGRLAACHNCHVDRAHDDFLFGIPNAGG